MSYFNQMTGGGGYQPQRPHIDLNNNQQYDQCNNQGFNQGYGQTNNYNGGFNNQGYQNANNMGSGFSDSQWGPNPGNQAPLQAPLQTPPYQNPFEANRLASTAQYNDNAFNNNLGGVGSSQQQVYQNTTGYRDPFSNPMQPLGSNLNDLPQLPGQQNIRNGLNPGPYIDTMSPQQTNFLKQVQSFLVQYNLEIFTVLVKELGVPETSQFISVKDLDALGRHARAEILEPNQLNDLGQKLTDNTQRYNPPNIVYIPKLRKMLNSTGVSTIPLSQPIAHVQEQMHPKGPLQPLKDLMAALNYQRVEQLFTDHIVPQGGIDGDSLIDREFFSRRLTEEAKLSFDEIQKVLKSVEAIDGGKVSLKKLEAELNKAPVLGQPETPKMTPEKADGIIKTTFDQLKRFIAMNEVNVVDIFQECEKDDGYFNRMELTDALMRLGFNISGIEHEDRIDALFYKFDARKTLKLDYLTLLNSFYKQANERIVTDERNKYYKVYDQTRRFMRQKTYMSVGSIFLAEYYLISNRQLMDAVKQGQDISYDKNDFLHQLTKVVGIKELDSMLTQQGFILEMMKKGDYNSVDYHKFADFVGYEMPKKSNKEEIRKIFYRILLKDMGSIAALEQSLGKLDINLQGQLQLNSFTNVIERFSQTLAKDPTLIKQVTADFVDPQQPYLINYQAFIQRVREEVTKQTSISKVFRNINEHMQFKDTNDLYSTLFQWVDTTGDRRYAREQLRKIFQDKLGYSQDTAAQDVEQFFFEYDHLAVKANTIKYVDIERDYKEYVDTERKLGRLPRVTNLPTILGMINTYVKLTGQTLRQIFNKQKSGDDHINQYQFSKIIYTIAQYTNGSQESIDDVSIHLLMNQISTTSVSRPGSPMKGADNGNHVSFGELLSLYNSFFKISSSEGDSLVPQQVERLRNYLAKVALENRRNNFDLKQHFQYPQTYIAQFVADLKKEPLNSAKDYPQNILEELGKKYYSRDQVVNTQMFVAEIESQVERLKEKNAVFADLRKQIKLKNMEIETVFRQALPEVVKFKIEYIAPEEFFNVFMFVECKSATLPVVKELLRNVLTSDSEGKYSYLEFISEFRESLEQDQTQARKGRRFYQTKDEVVKRIAYVIEHRCLRTFGSLLADQDADGRQQLERDQFYRTIDSLQFGLGEGDIQELIRYYSVKGEKVDIGRFKDELNSQIVNPDLKVELRSVLNNLLAERVVDHIEDGTPRTQAKVDAKQQAAFRVLAIEVVCGLWVRDTDVMGWFPKFSTFRRGSLTNKEFQAAIEQLDATQMIEQPERVIQQYYDGLLARQTVGYSETLLLVDQLNMFLYKDCAVLNRAKMVEDILQTVTLHVAGRKLPVIDLLKSFDHSGTMYRADFYTSFLDNYMGMQPNPKEGTGLSINQKMLLTMRYAPSQAVITFQYEEFINDLRRKQDESRGAIKVFFTRYEVEEAERGEKMFEEEKIHAGDQALATAPKQADLPVNSKRNTFVTDRNVAKPQLRGSIQVSSYVFDDIMMATYRKGLSVEMYFRAFSKPSYGDQVLIREDFSRALSSLGIEWSSSVAKVNEVFDALDTSTHQGQLQRYISVSDIGEAVLLNAGSNVGDFLAIHLYAIHKALKAAGMLARLRDLLNFINSNRDNTCAAQEFKKMLLEKLELNKVIKEAHVDYLCRRYISLGDRVDFSLFLRDMEFCDEGISPALTWAVELASDLTKGLIVGGFSGPEQLLYKYQRVQGVLTFDEFRQAVDELRVSQYHAEEELREFFGHASGAALSSQQTQKVATSELISTLKKLGPKSVGLVYQEVIEKLWKETKRNNMSLTTVSTAFSEYDHEKFGGVTYSDFKGCIQDRLRVNSLKDLDIEVLAKRYKVPARGRQTEDMVQYDKFFQDYSRFEQLGFRAGFDLLKEKALPETKLSRQLPGDGPKPQSDESKKIYTQFSQYAVKINIVDKLCDSLGAKDAQLHRGQLSYNQILETFRTFGITLNTRQMTMLTEPLPADPLDNSYNYLIMIDLLFGKQKAGEVQAKYKVGAQTNSAQVSFAASSREVDMSQRLKDAIELNLSQLQGVVHSMSKGTYLLKDTEFQSVFRQVGIVCLSQDNTLFTQAFGALKNVQSQTIDFRTFLRRYGITDTTAQLLNELQRQISANNIRLVADEEGATGVFPGQETVSLEDFNKFLSAQKITLPSFTTEQVSTAFAQFAERKDRIVKSQLIRILKNERDTVQAQFEYLPFIVNEFIFHIVNNHLQIFQYVNASAKRLTIPLFQTLMNEKLKYKPSQPKDLPTLYQFFGVPQEEGVISIDKIVEQIKKRDPTLVEVPIQRATIKQQPLKAGDPVPEQQTKIQQVSAVKQLSMFSPKIKDILKLVNAQVRINGLTNTQVFKMADLNGNGVVEKGELISFFTKDLQVKGITVPGDVELLFDALDMNKDGQLSISEFCLLLEGVQINFEQRLRNFDPDLEKSIKNEINMLFDFFDTNGDGQISIEELQVAMRASNPTLSLKEVQAMMKEADVNSSNTIDRQEFMNVMLPKLKQEMIGYEKNLDDLRRLFKEFDADHSNYLSRDELQQALARLGIVLSQVQFDELMHEIDIDGNQVIDIDEFIAFLSIADQIKFRNPNTKATIVKVKHARKLQTIDFYNCFKNLPQFFQPSITQEALEKRYSNTPSWGLYPEFDSRTLTYKDMGKLEEVVKVPVKKYIEQYQPQLACELTLEEATNIPLPKKEDYDWAKITNREVRAVLVDLKTHEFLSNVYIVSANWKPEQAGKWLFNASETHQVAKSFMLRTDIFTKGVEQQVRDVQLLFELVFYSTQNDVQQQICCAWGTIPVSQLDKQAKHKVAMKGGSPFFEMIIDKQGVFQEAKKGFDFLKLITANTEEALLIVTVKPFAKFTEVQQLHMSMLPSTCLFNRRLLSFLAAFRTYAFRSLTKAQQQMIAPNGNFAIAQFRKIFDNPDANLLLAECWEAYEASQTKAPTLDQLMVKMEDFLIKVYAVIYSEQYHFDHVYPTRSLPLDSALFLARETLIKQQLAPTRLPKKPLVPPKKEKENLNVVNLADDYKPFNISEMEIKVAGLDNVGTKQDELTKMYQQLGLLY